MLERHPKKEHKEKEKKAKEHEGANRKRKEEEDKIAKAAVAASPSKKMRSLGLACYRGTLREGSNVQECWQDQRQISGSPT